MDITELLQLKTWVFQDIRDTLAHLGDTELATRVGFSVALYLAQMYGEKDTS